VTAAAVRLIDLGLFRIGGEKYAELDHHYGATTLQKHDVTVTCDGVTFDYIAKEGKYRTITVTAAVRGVADWLGDTPAVARGARWHAGSGNYRSSRRARTRHIGAGAATSRGGAPSRHSAQPGPLGGTSWAISGAGLVMSGSLWFP
jgi:Eukaryotic DNA topoisomerase I, catalytic core